MRWTPGGRSEDLEDRRSSGGGGFGGGGGRKVGIGGLLLLGVLSMVFKKDLVTPFLGTGQEQSVAPDPARDAAEEKSVLFVSFVLDDNQKTWEQIFARTGKQYRRAKLALFREATQTACGQGEAGMGPFYCPGDEKVYIDLAFYDELRKRFGAPGDFAQAYVIAHEIGHHVQNLLGIEKQVRRLQQERPSSKNQLSVGMELQADCFAGLWGHSTAQRNLLEPGDVEEAMGAASAVGDDNIQKMSGQRTSPESFTHGSSKQRMQWYRKGLETGDLEACNTFASQ
jgi:predicted metalloprotease